MKRLLRNIDDVREWCSHLYRCKLPLRVAAMEGEDRSQDQNQLMWQWETEVGQQTGETKECVHRESKLSIGCPILCRDSDDFELMYRTVIAPLPRDSDDDKVMTRLKMMDHIPITRILTVRQMSEFLDQFERKHRAAGLALTDPEGRK